MHSRSRSMVDCTGHGLLSRRRFLAVASSAAAAALLAACGGGTDTSTPTPAPAATTAKPTTGSGGATTAPATGSGTTVGGATVTGGSAIPGSSTVSAGAGAATAVPKPAGNYNYPTSLKKGVTLRYQTFWAQYRIDILKQSITDFTQRTGINVTVEPFGSADDYRSNLATTMAAGTASDVFIADIWNMVKYYDAGLVLDIADRVKADGIDLNKEYGLVGLEQYCGKTYMMPFVLSPHGWYYNKTMLKEVGAKDPWDDLNGQWTFDDFREIALKITQSGGGKRWGAKLDPKMEYQWDPIINTYGGAVTDFKANPPKYAIDQPKSIEALGIIQNWYTKDKIILPPDQSKALTDQGVTSPFAAKLVGLMEESTGQITFLTQNVKDFEWDIAPPLRKTKDATPIGHADGDPTAIFAKTKYPDEAYAFAKHLAGPVTQEILAKNKLLTPTLKAAAASEEYLSPPPKHLHVFPDVLAGAYRTSFYHGNGLETSRQLDNFAEELVLGSKSPGDAAAVAKDVNSKVKFGACTPTYLGG